MSADNGSLPRLGSPEASAKRAAKTKVVELPDRGASVVLAKPSLGLVLDVQKQIDKLEDDDGFESSVLVVSRMLDEPKMSEEQLRAEVLDWSMGDWQILQTAAMELAGLSEEGRRSAEREFRDQGS